MISRSRVPCGRSNLFSVFMTPIASTYTLQYVEVQNVSEAPVAPFRVGKTFDSVAANLPVLYYEIKTSVGCCQQAEALVQRAGGQVAGSSRFCRQIGN